MSNNHFSVEDVKKKIKNIMEEPEVRFCGLIDSSGELIAGDFKNEIMPLVTDKQRRQMFQELAHRVANRQGFDSDLGRVKYSASRREKVVMMSFPIGRYIILIITELSINIDRFAWKIIYKLENQWSEFYGF